MSDSNEEMTSLQQNLGRMSVSMENVIEMSNKTFITIIQETQVIGKYMFNQRAGDEIMTLILKKIDLAETILNIGTDIMDYRELDFIEERSSLVDEFLNTSRVLDNKMKEFLSTV